MDWIVIWNPNLMGIFKKQNSSNFLRHFYVVDSYPSEREQYRLAIFRETRLL